MKKIINYIRKLIIFIFAFLLSFFFYNRKYLKGKYFKGRCFGIMSIGWTWVLNDIRTRLFLGANRGIPFPTSHMNSFINFKNVIFDVDDLNNFQGSGKYFQTIGNGKIVIGKGTWIANNVGIITTNHNISNLNEHLQAKDVIIGENCWIGMNSVILPGVELGRNTVVGAGSIVTKSFKEGNCTIVGNPAKIIKNKTDK